MKKQAMNNSNRKIKLHSLYSFLMASTNRDRTSKMRLMNCKDPLESDWLVLNLSQISHKYLLLLATVGCLLFPIDFKAVRNLPWWLLASVLFFFKSIFSRNEQFHNHVECPKSSENHILKASKNHLKDDEMKTVNFQ